METIYFKDYESSSIRAFFNNNAHDNNLHLINNLEMILFELKNRLQP